VGPHRRIVRTLVNERACMVGPRGGERATAVSDRFPGARPW